jgi:hypothetical protein
MTTRPQPLRRLATIQSAADLAHLAIFDMHRELLGRDDVRAVSAGLLAESAQIATVRLPGLTAPLRRLGARWEEQSLLDPTTANDTADQIIAGFADIEPDLGELLARQREIAACLRELLAS